MSSAACVAREQAVGKLLLCKLDRGEID